MKEQKNYSDDAAAPTKPPLVIFAPHPLAKGGIASYVRELMPFHLRDFEVTLVVADDADMVEEIEPDIRVLLASEFRKHHAFFESASKLYHVGNNSSHAYMLDFIARDPGIVVLHDFNLNYLHQTATLRWDERDAYRAVMEREYGIFGDENVDWQFERADRETFATYEMPCNGGVLDAAKGVITHSRYVQYKVAARAPGVPVWCIPHHVSPLAHEFAHITKTAARKQLGLPTQTFIVTALGFVTRAKKISMVLAALAELRARVPPFRFVLAGERRPEEYDISAEIEEFGLNDLTVCTDYLNEQQFFLNLAATDAIANLRYPSGGETSGTLIRALAMGTPAIVFDYGPMGELPDTVVKKVAWGEGAQISLTKALYELMTEKSGRLDLGARAAAYARNKLDIESIAQRYSKILRSGQTRPFPTTYATLRQYFPAPKEAARRLRTTGPGGSTVLPQAVDGKIWISAAEAPLGQAGQSAMVVAPRPQQTAEILSAIFEWPPATITAITPDEFLERKLRGRGGAPVPAGAFAFVLLIVPADLGENRAALLMRRLNAAVCLGGSVTLETWTELDRDNADTPLCEKSLASRLRDAGFSAVRQVSPQDGFFRELLMPDDGDNLTLRFACVCGRKASEFATWRFVDKIEGLPACQGGRSR